ncbi:MAG: MATE family efflux transporter [Clostridia bacterium]|nr:MATE family efflux transporter [Clostridia bacterium]
MALQRKSVDMTQGTIWKLLLSFALPMLIGQIFQLLYSTVDSIVVGRFVGKEALAAVGSTSSIINSLIGFFAGMATGAGVVISQSFGARDHKGVHDAVHTALLLTFLAGIFVTILGVSVTPALLRFMDTPPDVMGEAVTYLRIYFSGVMGLMYYNIGSGILRAVGDSRRPLYFLIFSACTNVVLDLLFVIAFRMGVAGVAWATVISQILSAILILIVLSRSSESYRFIPRDMRLHRSVLQRILLIGLPSGLQNSVVSFSNVFVQAYINAFQSSCMAGWASYNRLDAFAWLPMMCLGMGITTFTGQNLGAGNLKRAKEGARIALMMSFAGTTVIVAALMLFSDQALRLFNSDPEVIRYGRMFILYLSPFYIPFCISQIYAGALRGAGASTYPMMICIFSFVLFRQAYLFIGTRLITSPIFTGLSYPAGWLMSSTLMYIAYKRGRWEKSVSLKQNVQA